MEASYIPAPFASTDSGAVEAGAEWLVALLTGSLAVGLCVLAIAVIGLLMLNGRLPVRAGLRVVLGCFVLLGAPVIAAAFVMVGQDTAREITSPEVTPQTSEGREELPPSTFDPYAGASLRQE